MDKAALVAVGSSLAASCVVYNVWLQKQQFYPTVVHISKSSSCMAVFYIQAFSLVYLFAHVFRKVFFGTLRAAETEHLIERSWYALTETCLAFTVFRDDLSPSFIAQFAVLLFLKAFHWLLEDRIDYMERSPVIGIFFHLRALSLMSILALCDAVLLSYAAHVTLQKGATVHLVFGFEYVVLLLLVTTILVKYILHLIDLRHENQWANKTIYLLYTELIIGAIKVLMYAMFVTIMIRVHTFPLFVIRPMYLALRQFQKTLVDVIKSRKATYNMRERYPDATPEEINSGDNTCIICREEMVTAKKLPCGHIFHLECLRSWLIRQQTCPTCRIDILQQQAAQPPPRPNNVPLPPGYHGPPPPIFTWENNNNPNNNNINNNNNNNNASGSNNNNNAAGAASGSTPRFFIPPPAASNAQSFNISEFRMPPPPPSLHTLSEEELKAFEGATRQAVENRLVILRNVQMLMEAIQGQMQLYNSVAGPVPATTFIPSQSAAPAPEAPAPPPPAPEPYTVEIGGQMETFASKEDYEEEVDRRRDSLLRDYNLIDEEDFQAGERVREQLRARRLAALAPQAGPSAVVAAGGSEGTTASSISSMSLPVGDEMSEPATPPASLVTPPASLVTPPASLVTPPASLVTPPAAATETSGTELEEGLRKRNVNNEVRED